jgi:predicted dehydrogenase
VRGFVANADRFEVVGLCDRLPERLNDLGDQFDIRARYTDAEKMLAEQKPDVLCFVTLPEIRLALIELGIRHDVKAIAYEKPMAQNWPEACAIHRVVTAAGVKTIQSHQHKYGRHWQRARELVASGEIGEVQEVRASSKGWMLHYASHLMDYSMFLAGRDRVRWVVGHAHGRGKLFDNHPSPDYMLARYAFADGLPGLLECGTLAPTLPPGTNQFWMDAGVTVRGSNGFVQVVSGSGVWARTKSSVETLRLEAAFDPAYDQPPYFRELADWLDDDAKVHSCNGARAFHGFEVFMGACLSALDRRRVELPLQPDVDILGRLRAELPE